MVKSFSLLPGINTYKTYSGQYWQLVMKIHRPGRGDWKKGVWSRGDQVGSFMSLSAPLSNEDDSPTFRSDVNEQHLRVLGSREGPRY